MNRGWILFAFALVVTAAAAPFLGGGSVPEEAPGRVQPERRATAEAARHRSADAGGRRDTLMGFKDRGGRPAGAMTSWTPETGMSAPAPELTTDGPRRVPPPRDSLGKSSTTTVTRPSQDILEERIRLQEERRKAIQLQQEEAERRRREALERRQSTEVIRGGRGMTVPTPAGSRGGAPISRSPMVSSTLTVPTGATAQLPQGFSRSESGQNVLSDRLRETLGSSNNTGTNEQGRNNSNLPQEVLDRLNNFFGGNFTGGSSGSGSGGDGPTTGGSTTGSGPTVTTGSGGTAGPAGSSGQPVGTIRASARWIPVDNSACAEDLQSYRTNDLFIRAEAAFRVVSVQMGGTSNDGLSIAGGDFYQHAAGSNVAPSEAALRVDPCLAYDSFLAIGDAGIAFVPTPAAPSPEDWGVLVQGGWFTIEMANAVQNAARFGDSGYYLRVARVTAPSTLTDLRGEVAVTVSVNGQQQTLVLPISFCSDCWRSDLFDVGPSTPFVDDDDDDTDGGDGDGDGDGGDGDGSGDGDGDGGSGGDDGSGDGGDGDDDGGEGDGDGDTDDGDGDSSEDDEDDERVRAVWFVVNNTCDDDGDGTSDLAGLRTADLYVRTDGPHRVLSVVSGMVDGMNDGISVYGGSFWQYPGGNNQRPNPALVAALPCLAFDSWLTIGDAETQYVTQPDLLDWGVTLEAVWFTFGATAQRNVPVADGAYYVHLGRFTVDQSASVLGEIEIGFRFADEASVRTVLLEIPDLLDVP